MNKVACLVIGVIFVLLGLLTLPSAVLFWVYTVERASREFAAVYGMVALVTAVAFAIFGLLFLDQGS